MTENDFFESDEGQLLEVGWRRHWRLLRLADVAVDASCVLALKRARALASTIPSQRVLLAAVRTPGREADLDRVLQAISGTGHHSLDLAIKDLEPRGKFDNINSAISNHDLNQYDWLLVIDDDIELPKDFLQLFLYFVYINKLRIAQPAHRFASFASFRVTERHWNSLVRYTDFVEIGPVSLLHRDTFDDLLPSPSLRWAWGLDLYWSHVARMREWRMGVVDATPIRHTRPIGGSYSHDAARTEAIEFLSSRNIPFGRSIITSRNERAQ